MGRYFALTLDFPHPVQTKTKTKTKKQSGKTRINFGLWIALALIVSSVAYLVQANSSSTKGYEIKTLEKQLSDLKDADKRLELEAASLQAMDRIQGMVKTLNLVPSGRVQYVGEKGYAFQK